MRSFFRVGFTFFTLVSLSNFASAKESGVFVTQETGSWWWGPLSKIRNCSGGIARTSIVGYPNSFTFFMAKHCMADWRQGQSINVYVDAVVEDSWNAMIHAPYQLVFDAGNVHTHTSKDLVYFPIAPQAADVLKNVDSVRNLAPALPQIGSKISFVGYPLGVGPVRINCTLDGTTLSTDLHQSLLAQRATCETNGNMNGASGSVVLNDKNEMIGVVTFAGERDSRLFIHFAPMTQEDLVGDELPVQLKDPSGIYSYKDVIGTEGTRARLTVKINESGLLEAAEEDYEMGMIRKFFFYKAAMEAKITDSFQKPQPILE